MLLSNDREGMREALFPKVRTYAESLEASVSLVADERQASVEDLGEWLAAREAQHEIAPVIAVCTGNSRRSILASTLGNLAAAFYGFPTVAFYSGGTNPSAFNPRTQATLREVGVVIEPLEGVFFQNQHVMVRLGDADFLQQREFSKHYADPHNPQNGFAAVMVCDHADENCPFVPGASLRLSLPFADPVFADETPLEAEVYGALRDEIGQVIFTAFRVAVAKRDGVNR